MSQQPRHAAGQGVLPAPVHGTLRASLIIDAARDEGTEPVGLAEEVAYSAFEADDRRFAWLHNTVAMEAGGVQFLMLDLRGSDGEWDIVDIDRYDSPEDALQAAGRAWVKANGGPDLPTEPVADW